MHIDRCGNYLLPILDMSSHKTTLVVYVYRFRREAREEQKYSLSAYIECLTELASSSVVLIVILTLGIVATTIACLPLLLGLKFISLFVADSKDIDSSVVTSGVDRAEADSSFAEGLVTNLFGGSCPEDDKRYSRVWELK